MGWTVEVVERSPRRGWIMTQDQGLVWVTLPKTFERLPRRWVVEHTYPRPGVRIVALAPCG